MKKLCKIVKVVTTLKWNNEQKMAFNIQKRALNIPRGFHAQPTHPPRYATKLTNLKTKAVSSTMD